MHPVTAAYLAAMVEGEGVVTIGRLRSRGRRRQFKYYARVLVTNSHEGLVRFMYEATGLGLVYRYSHAARRAGRSCCAGRSRTARRSRCCATCGHS
jgi:hypothetical protein